ncbi:glycoside hydrolase domain-containing protein [Gemmatimonadota bacterium]
MHGKRYYLSAALLLLLATPVFGKFISVPTNLIRVVDGRKNYGVPGLPHPIVDGSLEDVCWSKASRISGFNTVEGRYGGVQKTDVYLLYSDQEAWHEKGAWRLHLGFKCYNSQMDKLNRIDGYYRDAFYPDREAINILRSRPMAFFKVNGQDVFPHWEYQSSRYDDHWVQERAVFVDEILDGKPEVGDSITLQFYRRNGVFNEDSWWKGTLVFGEALDPVCEILDFGELTMGENEVQIELLNNSGFSRAVLATVEIIPLKSTAYTFRNYSLVQLDSLELAGEPYDFPTGIKLAGDEKKKALLSYTIREEGEHYLTLTLSSPESGSVYLRTGFLFTVVANGKTLAELSSRFDRLGTRFATADGEIARALSGEFSQLKNNLGELNRELKKKPAPGFWRRLTQELAGLEFRIASFGHKLGISQVYGLETGDGAPLEYGAGVASNLVKLRRDRPFEGEITNRVEISACGNEYEGFQLVVLPLGKDLRHLEISAGDLVNIKTGDVIGAGQVQVSAVGYVHTALPTYETEYIGWWPDPLLPLTEPYFDGIKAEQLLQPFWVTVYVPAGTPAGNYSGELTIAPANSHRLSLSLTVRVRGFDIPVTPRINEFFRFYKSSWESFYNRSMTVEEYRQACAFQLSYRIGQPNAGSDFISYLEADSCYDYSLADQNLKFCLERGLNVFDISFANVRVLTPEGLDKAMDVLAGYADHLKETGLFEHALVEPLNEVSAEVTLPFYKMMKQRIPGLRILQKGGGSNYYDSWRKGEKAPLEGTLDIWCPDYVPPPQWDQAIAERHAGGEECWVYHDYVDCVIDRPAINLRKIHWRAWSRKLDGMAYWSTNFWPLNVRKGETVGKKWPFVDWQAMSHPFGNGDGQFIYPGPGGKLLSSVRLEILRDAQEDYEYLYTLGELTDSLRREPGSRHDELIREAEKLLDLDNSLPEPVTPDALRKLRDRIGEKIERIGAQL